MIERLIDTSIPANSTSTLGVRENPNLRDVLEPKIVSPRIGRLLLRRINANSSASLIFEQYKINETLLSGIGRTLNEALDIIPSEPKAPVWRRCISNPLTFFTTRPPLVAIDPSAITTVIPKIRSRVDGTFPRQAPERAVASKPPIVTALLGLGSAGRYCPNSARTD